MEIVGAVLVIGLIGFALWKQINDNLTKQCPNCRKRIPDKAAVCPHCAYRFREVPRPSD
jgi:predicted amidophosphoribosyltransferase